MLNLKGDFLNKYLAVVLKPILSLQKFLEFIKVVK